MTEKKKKNIYIYKYKYIWNIFFYLFFYFIYLFIYFFLLLFSGTQLRICVQVATPLQSDHVFNYFRRRIIHEVSKEVQLI